MPTVELSQLSNGVYGVAGYALVAELRRDEVSNISMVVCTFEILVTFPSSQLALSLVLSLLHTLLYELCQL